jgi:hypothetical protein
MRTLGLACDFPAEFVALNPFAILLLRGEIERDLVGVPFDLASLPVFLHHPSIGHERVGVEIKQIVGHRDDGVVEKNHAYSRERIVFAEPVDFLIGPSRAAKRRLERISNRSPFRFQLARGKRSFRHVDFCRQEGHVDFGSRGAGREVLLAVKNMGGESETAWRVLLDDLVKRGLKTPELVIVDGAPGLDAALAVLWSDVAIQRYTVHKRR